MNKTFKELMSEIKDGETWSSGIKIVECINGSVTVKYNDYSERNYMMFNDKEVFKKVKTRYDFDKAFTAYSEKGKEIESIQSGICYKKVDKKDCFKRGRKGEWRECSGIDFYEMNEKWYIND